MFKFRVWEMPFPMFSAGHFQQISTKGKYSSQLFILPIRCVISVHGKKGKTVKASRQRFQAKGEMSTLQAGKDTNIKAKHAFRREKFFFQISAVRTGIHVCARIWMLRSCIYVG